MKIIQGGILACLLAITGLLFAIYQKQAEIAPPTELAGAFEPSDEVYEPEEAAIVAPEIPRPIEPAPEPAPVRRATFRPQPERYTAPPLYEERQPIEPSDARLAVTPPPAPEPDFEPVVAAELPRAARTPVAPLTTPEPREVTLPAGTRLSVRLGGTLSTNRNVDGDDFIAYLDEPLIVDGLVIAEKGAAVGGRVVESRRAGRVSGRSYLSVELVELATADGQQARLSTTAFREEGRSTRNGDLKKVGIGAAVGAAIGAIAGGGKGAAIGAGAGAGAGGGVAAAQRGEPVVWPPESRLEFELAASLTLTEKL